MTEPRKDPLRIRNSSAKEFSRVAGLLASRIEELEKRVEELEKKFKK